MKALLVISLVGCASGSTYRTTRIAPPGTTEWLAGLQVSGAGLAGTAMDGSAAGRGVAPLPELALAARRGLDDRVELQANATVLSLRDAHTGSLELAAKVQLYEHGRWSLATGAGAGYRVADVGGAMFEDVFASAPLIGGVDLGRHQLVVSLDAGVQRLYASGARPVTLPYLGTSLGFLWQLGRSWALLPELGSDWSPTPNFMTDNSRLFHVGIAVMWTR